MTAMDDVSAKIGELSGKLDGLQRAHEAAEARSDAAHRGIAEHLKEVNRRLECLPTIRVAIEDHQERLHLVENAARDYTEKKNRLLGAAALLGVIGGGVGWMINRLWP